MALAMDGQSKMKEKMMNAKRVGGERQMGMLMPRLRVKGEKAIHNKKWSFFNQITICWMAMPTYDVLNGHEKAGEIAKFNNVFLHKFYFIV